MIFNELAVNGKFLKKSLYLDDKIKECVLARFEEKQFQEDVSVNIVMSRIEIVDLLKCAHVEPKY